MGYNELEIELKKTLAQIARWRELGYMPTIEQGIALGRLQKIYAIIFGKKISKAQRLSNWEAPTLSVPQQYYAALDAWACLHIYNALLQKEPFYINSLPLPDRKEEKNSII